MDRRGPLEPRRELSGAAAQPGPKLLQPPRYLDRPASVAEVALDLARDVRNGERPELDSPFRIEAIYGLDQADASHLNEVFVQLPPHAVAAGDALHQRHVLLDEPLASAQVAVFVVLAKERVDRLPAGARRAAPWWRRRPVDTDQSRSRTPPSFDLCRNCNHLRLASSPQSGDFSVAPFIDYSDHLFVWQMCSLFVNGSLAIRLGTYPIDSEKPGGRKAHGRSGERSSGQKAFRSPGPRRGAPHAPGTRSRGRLPCALRPRFGRQSTGQTAGITAVSSQYWRYHGHDWARRPCRRSGRRRCTSCRRQARSHTPPNRAGERYVAHRRRVVPHS